MTQFFSVSVHNNQVGVLLAHDSLEDAIEAVISTTESTLNRSLTPDEHECLANDYIVYDDSDCDNVWTFQVVTLNND